VATANNSRSATTRKAASPTKAAAARSTAAAGKAATPKKAAAPNKRAAESSAARRASSGRVHLGVDIGGSGIKAAPVDVTTGALLQERVRLDTPVGAKPDDVDNVIEKVVRSFSTHGPIGMTFPGVVIRGTLHTAANVDKSWIGVSLSERYGKLLDRPVVAMNDADAAGVAEMRFGAGRGRRGVVMMITLGTGIGCAVFNDGVLMPNTELGHLEINGNDAEDHAAARVRDDENLSWEEYAKRVQRYVRQLDALLWPDLVIIGGGISKKADKFLPLIKTRCELIPARLLNDAGIVGAAVLAAGR